MSSKDLYAILGVNKKASPQEIKKAYRKIARESHPDVKPGDASAEKRFKEATSAFEVLSNPDKRKLYDEFGEDSLRMGFEPEKARAYKSWQGSAGGRGFEGFGGFNTGTHSGFRGFQGDTDAAGFDLGDILGDLFGGSGKKRSGRRSPFGSSSSSRFMSRKGNNAETSIKIPLKDAVLGATREIAVEKPRKCGTCNGKTAKETQGCRACAGTGFREGRSRLKVKIPAGVTDGQRIRLSGQGLSGTGGGAPGDLYVSVQIEPHSLVQRKENDLYMDLPVTVSEAMNGAILEVPTFQGSVKVKIPPGSQSGRKLRLKGRGVNREGKQGDLYLLLSIKLPSENIENEKIQNAIKTLENHYSSNPRKNITL